MIGFGFGFGFNTLATLLNQTPSFLYSPIEEDRARIANKTYSFTGTNIYVDSSMPNDTGNGLTPATAKKHIQSGYTVASNGSIVHLKGTFDLKDGVNGYWYMATANKSVMFVGDTDNKADTVVNCSVAGGIAAIYKNIGGLIVFKNLTVSIGLDIYVFYCAAGAYDSSVVFDNVALINTHAATSKDVVLFQDAEHTYTRWYEFNNCHIEGHGNRINARNLSATETLLLTGANSMYRGDSGAVLSITTTASINAYDINIEQSANTYAISFGSDTAAPSALVGLVDFRGCSIKYIGTGRGHAVLLGRGVLNLYFVNNKVELLPINDVSNIGIVTKSLSTDKANYVIKGNWVKGIRPFVGTGQNMDIQFNAFICNSATYAGFNIFNIIYATAVDYNCRANKIENNIIYAPVNVIMFSATGTSEATKVSLLTGTFTNNKYCTDTGRYLFDTLTAVEFADRVTYWGSAFDNSQMFTEIAQP